MGKIADKIREAILGSDVREAIAEGIEETERLRDDYNAQVINAGNSNAEIVDARGGQEKLKDRLDLVDSQLAHNVQQTENLKTNKADKLEVDIERKRIDEMLTIPVGGTTADAALNDIKIGADGKIYDTPGNSVRNQLINIKGQLNRVVTDIENDAYTKENITYTYNAINIAYNVVNNVATKVTSTYMKSTEIPVSPFEKYKITTTIGNNWWGFIFTDSNNNVIATELQDSTWRTYNEYVINIPNGATKLCINCSQSYAITIKRLKYNPIATKDMIPTLGNVDTLHSYKLPEYYSAHLDAKISEINTLEYASGFDGATYQFVTDMHTKANKLSSLPLMERIREKTNGTRLINCGDNVTAIGTREDIKKELQDTINKLYPIFGANISFVLGNHDFMISNSPNGTWDSNYFEYIDKSTVYAILNIKTGVDSKKLYHYWDDKQAQIRHIFIDFIDIDKAWFIDWFKASVDVPNGWSLCFYNHINMLNVDTGAVDTTYTYLVNWICAIQNKTAYNATVTTTTGDKVISADYSGKNTPVCYVAGGHQHKDSLYKYNNVNFFTTDCDACYNNNGVVQRIAGTITENAFDVIHINTKTKTVNLIRVGAGSNRNFTY